MRRMLFQSRCGVADAANGIVLLDVSLIAVLATGTASSINVFYVIIANSSLL